MIGEGRLFISKWSEVKTMSLKVVSDFKKPKDFRWLEETADQYLNYNSNINRTQG